MRSTWLKPEQLQQSLGMRIKILFFLGSSEEMKDQLKVRYESELYGDIVQVNFSDMYEHNTYKAMSYLL